MARRIAQTTLNASTIDILNVIRQNASYDYQQNVPAVQTANDIPKVGEVIYGTPAFANQFINALVNRKSLARTSGQPGKTQTINFYNVNEENIEIIRILDSRQDYLSLLF